MLLLAPVAIAAAKSASDIHCFSDLKDVRGPMDPCPNAITFSLECGLRSPPLRQAIRLASPHCDPNRSIFTANVRYALTPLLAQSDELLPKDLKQRPNHAEADDKPE